MTKLDPRAREPALRQGVGDDTLALAPRDRELADTLRVTLERKAAQPDVLLDAALAATRAQIAAGRGQRRLRHPWWLAGGFALAASLAVVLVLPGRAPEPATPALAEAAMPDADLQFLQDMDLLVAVSGKDHEG